MGVSLVLGAITWPSAVATSATWLLTYTAHAAVWAAVAWTVARSRSLSSAGRHLVWKGALLGPLATTAVAAALSTNAATAGPPTYRREITVMTLASGTPAGERRGDACGTTSLAVCAALAVVTALGPTRLLLSLLLLRRRLRDRRPVRDVRLLERLELLRARMQLGGVVLTECEGIASPLVAGRAEICLPSGCIAELDDPELDAVLAHELAHLERGDAIAFLLTGIVETVFWMQPLVHLVAARVRSSAELASDDRAVALTGDPLGLANALAQVAASALFGARRGRVLLLPTMARAGSTLTLRVRRLVDHGVDSTRHAPARHPGWAFAGVLVAGSTLVGVSVHVRDAAASAHELSSAAAAPDADGASVPQQFHRLSQRAARHEAELAVTPAGVHAEELQQQIRHDREALAWLEQRASGPVSPP